MRINGLLRCFECYLQVSCKNLYERDFQSGVFTELSKSFLGALNSDRLVNSSLMWKYTMTRVWLSLMEKLKDSYYKIDIPTFAIRSTSIDPTLQILAAKFSALPLNEEKVWLWRGWVSVNRNGKVNIFPLYPVYIRLGRVFTQRFFEVCDQYFRARKSTSVPALRSLTRFIGQYPGKLNPSDLLRQEFVGQFWRDFFVFHVTNAYAEGSGQRITSIITLWRTHFISFIKEHFTPSGLIVEPWGELPNPEPKYVRGARTNIVTTPQGLEVKTKLLTHIPLQVTDEDAILLLFSQIENDLQIVKAWADCACKNIWMRYERRNILAQVGIPRLIQDIGTNSGNHRWLTDRANPDYLKIASATLAHHGFLTGQDAPLVVLYPRPISQTAAELALPTTDALLAHCFVLVLNHPAITPSFLEKLEVFDKNGKLTGFVETDSGYHLVGHKDRRGPALAQQIISLNLETTEVVRQILEITSPLRNYLRGRGDDQWRYLLLTCKQGFGYPSRVRGLSTSTSDPARRVRLAKELTTTSALPYEALSNLVERLSLQTVRSSAAVLVYLKTRSAEKMAKALGHATYQPKLLEHYLPKPILDFFQERWIRIFQTGIIVEALKDSTHLFEASSFSSMDDLHQFLSNHALRLIPQHISDDSESTPISSDCQPNCPEVVFGVNVGILTALMSIKLTVDAASNSVDARAKYWAGISERIVTYIESSLQERSDLQSFVKVARSHARPFALPGVLNGV